MVRYEDIESHYRDYLQDSARHLFNIGGINVMFWSMRGSSWRIVTDLTVEVCQAIVRDLNDQLQSWERSFHAQEAWFGIRPKYRTPPMKSEIIGTILRIDMLENIWAALYLRSSNRPNDIRVSRRGDRFNTLKQLSDTVQLPKVPKGYAVDSIIDRLGVNIMNEDRCIVKNINDDDGDIYMESFILDRRNQGGSYSEIRRDLEDVLGKVVSKTYVYNVLKKRGLTKQKD